MIRRLLSVAVGMFLILSVIASNGCGTDEHGSLFSRKSRTLLTISSLRKTGE
jgi:hypothetical protein